MDMVFSKTSQTRRLLIKVCPVMSQKRCLLVQACLLLFLMDLARQAGKVNKPHPSEK
jgi:hypothetical protein